MMVVKNSLVNPNQASKLGEIVKQNDDFTKMLDDMNKKNDEIKKINDKFTKELKEQDKIFKQFDLAFIRNQIIFGNLDEAERSKLFKKSLKIAKELSEL
ncbi:Uncharacterised protein [Campylobacter sputorum subsp. bubulus]|uniref:Uncharacterized protein n=1 Tax=Campylobacter sputorum subsp. sputorum TaxID=32024 RepID=A0A381DKI2_9BACT|nr:hypothetical protein [Campylobacter sputorum]ASM34439.1 hypothetical protein CSPUT_0174 [Campylobacter sputorum aubsp. sputorum RM3237]KAB0582174.1 hypothetical protein F7P64_02565 [Campylobacter sputorum subsp. sputorum]QEL04630.1 hypothetical protein CSPT_0174 [Campylobacter sputorum subsp. sputorum]SUX09433.1 Uncharacterised protein [Campylobacter sputorum subsp. bubulus]SUX11100.1 Uncharacterised protein [Campylobacter sputorum subsp. sputorum]